MALTLTESAKLTQNELHRGVLETFVLNSAVLDRIPFKGIQGNAYAYNEEASLPGVAFRGVNEAYTESTGTVNQKVETLKIMGGDADVDRYIEQTQSNINDQRAVQLAMKIKALVYAFQNAFFNGNETSNPKEFDGLRTRLVGNQVIDAGPNGLPVIGSSDSDIFALLDKLDELLAAVPGIDGTNGVIYANAAIIQKLRSAMRRLKIDSIVESDVAGKRTIEWNGVPLHPAGATPAGIQILAQTETLGTSEVTSSIYAVKYGEDVDDQGVTGLWNGGLDVRDLGELQEKPVYRHRIEFYPTLALFSGKAAARLRGVINA